MESNFRVILLETDKLDSAEEYEDNEQVKRLSVKK
jgi:hypothetical protein